HQPHQPTRHRSGRGAPFSSHRIRNALSRDQPDQNVRHKPSRRTGPTQENYLNDVSRNCGATLVLGRPSDSRRSRSSLIQAMKKGGEGISYRSYAEVSFHPTSNDDPVWASLVPAFPNASVTWSRCFLLCALVTIVRILALSLPTIRNTIGRTNTPSLNISSASLWAFPLSPTMTGVISVSLCPVSKPSSFN